MKLSSIYRILWEINVSNYLEYLVVLPLRVRVPKELCYPVVLSEEDRVHAEEARDLVRPDVAAHVALLANGAKGLLGSLEVSLKKKTKTEINVSRANSADV